MINFKNIIILNFMYFFEIKGLIFNAYLFFYQKILKIDVDNKNAVNDYDMKILKGN